MRTLEVLTDVVEAYIEERLIEDKSAQIRIMEIGTDDERTSYELFHKILPYSENIKEYCYAHTSESCLPETQKENGYKNSCLKYKALDIEEPCNVQGFDGGGYDIVIASDLLHDTKNIQKSIRNIKWLLQKNGLILLNENCQVLLPKAWQAILESEGFRDVFFSSLEDHTNEQQIIIAESDGIIRQKNDQNSGIVKNPVPSNEKTVKIKAVKIQKAVQAKMVNTDILSDKAKEYVKKMIGEILKIPNHKIDSSEYFEKYGIDSILSVQITDALQQGMDNPNSTLLFEYQTIDDLVDHLIKNQRDWMIKLVGLDKEETIDEILKENEEDFEDEALEVVTASAHEMPTNMLREKVTKPENFELENIVEDSEESAAANVQDIAIIGLSMRYPKAENVQEFWTNLQEGRDCITEVPKERWDHSLYFDEDKNNLGKTSCNWGGFINDIECFDPFFFNISPNEAEIMDPQERLFLECVWNLFESVGYTKEAIQTMYKGRVGVFAGSMYQHYQLLNSDMIREAAVSIDTNSSIANRVSFFFNLHGPSLSLDTACSSSATAIHMACRSLKDGECEVAVAGGVNLLIHPKRYVGFSMFKIIGSSNKSRSFADGDGFLPSEGIGAVLLKPLKKAIRDGDNIMAVIKSTSINHGGRANSYTAPNLNAESEVFEENFQKAGIDPRTISYVEAAANGSSLGDAIEVNALSKTFRKYTMDKQYCAIGSVKSNMGHAESASAIAQLAKVVLQLQHGKLVPSIMGDTLNPNINFSDTPFYLQKELCDWKRPLIKLDGKEVEIPRRATVSSFGGGTNVHMILEEYMPSKKESIDTDNLYSKQIVVLSAKNKERLLIAAQRMLDFSECQDKVNLMDITYTLQIGREAMEDRLAMIVESKEELVRGLREFIKCHREGSEMSSTVPVFTGNTENDNFTIGNFLSGNLGDTVAQMLVEQKNLEKLAVYWVQGGNIPWAQLHIGSKAHRIFLPTYPFEKRRCWVGLMPGCMASSEAKRTQDNMTLQSDLKIGKGSKSLNEKITFIISQLVGIEPEEVSFKKPLCNYGFDSISLLQLLQQLQKQIDPSVDLARLQECKTIQDIANIICLQGPMEESLESHSRVFYESFLPEYPELVKLNKNTEGRPVFWIHGAVGGAESFIGLAQKSKRPFYGIQARGWMTDRLPLRGIEAMAIYYVNIIRALQPEGPYDVGGYSLGGVIAYEVVRQLQGIGQTVNTIVMLDSPCIIEGIDKISFREAAFSTVNMALSVTIKNSEEMEDILINRDEVSSIKEDELFLHQLIRLAKERGLTKTETQLRTLIEQCSKVLMAYEMDKYVPLKLPDPQGVVCYYFNNKSGIYYGELEPYFTLASDENLKEQTRFWDGWDELLPDIKIRDIDSSNHMALLTEPKAYEPIYEFCGKLYSEKEMPTDFFEAFFQKYELVKS